MAGTAAAPHKLSATLCTPRLGWAWISFCTALALHITDEALTGFLDVWNPTMAALHARWPWMFLLHFRFETWLGGMIAVIVVLYLCSGVFFHGGGVLRGPAYVVALPIGIGNGLVHIVATVLGHTFPEVTFSRPAPGFYSSPFMIAAAVWLLVELRRTVKNR
jgi:hypothetical protein